jgi:general secretion pathway protein G
MRNKNKGFTLIEMLVVIAVIGLLAALILVGLSSFRVRGRDTRRVADVKEVQNGLELYYMKNGSYPTVSGGDAAARWGQLRDALTGAELGINDIPQDPTFPSRSYDYGSDGQHYVIAVPIEDYKSNPSLLGSDIDGIQTNLNNVDCGTNDADDSVYCVGM